MNLSTHVLGTNIVTKLQASARAPVLVIGADKFTRSDLSGIACFNFVAATRLSIILKTLDVASTRDLFQRIPPGALVLPHLGSISLAVLGAAFEVKGLGGDAPLDAWVTKHRDKDERREYVTFHTMKARSRDRRAARDERRAAKARKHSRRDQAHRLRVDRFERRQASDS